MVSLIWFLLLLYAAFNGALVMTWLRMKTFTPSFPPPWEGGAGGGTISVVVVVRNEAGNIVHLLEDLNRQTYPAEQFEVIVVDDGSTDDTFGLVSRFVGKAGYPLRLFSLSTLSTSPKKRGITEAIRIARGELIVTTDGDCRVGTAWLALIAHGYRDRRACLISGAVTFEGERNLLEKMQTVEFASLMGSGACALQWGLPTMCNGANLAYPKAVFEEVGGFAGIDHLASGDDELLMHKIARRYPGRIFFLKHPASVVRTRAQPTLGDLYQQRKRWASKWKAYRDWKVSGLAVFVFSSNLSLLVAAGSWAVGRYPLSAFLLQAWVKLSVEVLPLALFISYLQPAKRALRRTALIPLVQLVYPFYVVFFGLAAQRKGFVWKGRKMR